MSIIVPATKSDVKQGEYYGLIGPGEMGGFPALAVIDDATLDDTVAKRLWSKAEEITEVVFP